ncbi:MAG: PKD domain-containing protein, partial [Nitrososphaera sp.]|nr:PKD domain-containing protein [Nitrososphaera sp.]
IGQQPADNPDDEEDDPVPEQNSTDVNSKPIADAGASFSIIAGNEIALDGNSSHDPDGDALTFSWSQEDGPDASLDSPTLASPTITAPEVDSETTMTFKLVVSDGLLSSDPSSVIVTIIPVDIDVIPSIYPNKIYLSEPDVEIPVAIIGSASLNASSVDEESLTFGPGFAPAISFELVDFNSDGYTDLVSYHRTGDLGLQEEDKTACLSGSIEMNSDDVFEFSVCRNVKVFE